MYSLLDSGEGRKLERFGEWTLVRPCPQAKWKQALSQSVWEQADAHFSPTLGWTSEKELPVSWEMEMAEMKFLLKFAEGGQVGLFPEQEPLWGQLQKGKVKHALNLFAYTGGSSIAAAQGGAQVTHVDGSKSSVEWAKQNAELNGVNIRWLVDDVMKYLRRAVAREERYDALILDPPSFGRGAEGEIFKIVEHLEDLLALCSSVLLEGMLVLSCHTPHFTPYVLEQAVRRAFPSAQTERGELFLTGPKTIRSGAYVIAHL